MKNPLISFIVVSFNQEKFIREAVEGALSQTYSPLEIIISDDSSKDRTFEIASELVANYRGTHKVRLNRNTKNLGMGAHITHVMTMCSGELIVGAAGDDISFPERTAEIHKAWEATGRRATSIFSSYITISSEGAELGLGGTRGDPKDATHYRDQRGSLAGFLNNHWPVVVGCTHAWSPKLFEYFGPLKSDLEDLVLSFRSLAFGEMLYVNQPLIKYRRHDTNVSFFAGWDDTRSFEHREKRLRWVNEKTIAAYDNMIADIEVLFSDKKIPESERNKLRDEAVWVRAKTATELRMMTGNYFEKISTVMGAALRGDFRCAMKSMARLLPQPLFRRFYNYRAKKKAKNQTIPV